MNQFLFRLRTVDRQFPNLGQMTYAMQRPGLKMIALFACVLCSAIPASAQDSLHEALRKIVKLYGAGGVGRIEAYGTGIVVSPQGHVLTALTPLLESSPLQLVLWDGRNTQAKVVAIDTARQLALLQAELADMPAFDLEAKATASVGQPVFALSNCFGIAQGNEQVTLQRGVIAALANMDARQGFRRFSYPGKVYVIDAVTNNPGSPGGALVDASGQLIGILGKEIQSDATQTWVNFAIPAEDCHALVTSVLSGSFQKLPEEQRGKMPLLLRADLRGIIGLPEVLDKTPAYVDAVVPGSPAERSGLQPDDMVLFVENELIQSLADLKLAMSRVPANQEVKLVVLRDEQLVTVTIAPATDP